MFQKFFTDTIMSRFVKNLLATTPIPILPIVEEGDLLIGGCNYIYDRYVIKCVESGSLSTNPTDSLYPSDNIYPSSTLLVGVGVITARFKVLSYYSEDDSLNNYTYHSKFNYHDSETHKHLGEYLRSVKSKTGVDMMPYYNCCNYEIIYNLSLNIGYDSLNKKTVITNIGDASDKYKIYAVPIRFSRRYTIAVDCQTEVIVRGIIYNTAGVINKFIEHEDLKKSGKIFNSLSFNSPVVYSVSTHDKNLFSQQRNLYLLIQLPADNDSSIVVLEGDYSAKTTAPIRMAPLKMEMDGGGNIVNGFVREFGGDEVFNVYPSLLELNTKISYAFSYRLVEFLLGNLITQDDPFQENIAKIQQWLCGIDTTFNNYMTSNNKVQGIWNDETSTAIKRIVTKLRDSYSLTDMDGNANKDIEHLIGIVTTIK